MKVRNNKSTKQRKCETMKVRNNERAIRTNETAKQRYCETAMRHYERRCETTKLWNSERAMQNSETVMRHNERAMVNNETVKQQNCETTEVRDDPIRTPYIKVFRASCYLNSEDLHKPALILKYFFSGEAFHIYLISHHICSYPVRFEPNFSVEPRVYDVGPTSY